MVQVCFTLLFNNTYGLPVLTKDLKCPNKLFYVWLVYLNRLLVQNTGWERDSLQMMMLVNVCSTWRMVHIKDAFSYVNNKKWRKSVSLFHVSYLITLMAYLCSQWTPNAQIKYFMFDWSIYRLFVLNWAWKRVSLQIMIFVYVCSTWGIVERNTGFETSITIYDVNGVSLIHFP
jgi:hypothetical protein